MTKYKVDLHKTGSCNDFITRMIANHNAGASRFNLIDIVGYLNANKAAFPLTYGGFSYCWNVYGPLGTQIMISEDNNESYTMTITQVEMLELSNVQIAENLLP
jgi:hypothetical protein